MLSSAITGRSIADGAGGAALGGARLTRGSGGVRSHCHEFLGVWIVVTPISLPQFFHVREKTANLASNGFQKPFSPTRLLP